VPLVDLLGRGRGEADGAAVADGHADLAWRYVIAWRIYWCA
jgi:hypothetical protein